MKFKKVKWKKNYILRISNLKHFSYCNTTDNWPETAYYDWVKFKIYNWDYRKEIEKAKTIDEAVLIFLNLEAIESPYSS